MYYTVKKGDCLWNLAGKYYHDCTKYHIIAGANGIHSPYIIYPGQTLSIPGVEDNSGPVPPGGIYYIVKKGDCLWEISRYFYKDPTKFGIIANANSIYKPWTIYPGERLYIPYISSSSNSGSSSASSDIYINADYKMHYYITEQESYQDTVQIANPAPVRPAIIEFNKPMPTFTSDVEKVEKISYFFGIDKLKIYDMRLNSSCCSISEDIYIGEMSENGYISLKTDYVCDDNSSIEFYIIDNGKEIPILPEGDTSVQEEKIFANHKTRFQIDYKKPIEIRNKDMEIIGGIVENVTDGTKGQYVVSYTPIGGKTYIPEGEYIKVKTILRVYKENTTCYVKDITIKKYGGDTLKNNL